MGNAAHFFLLMNPVLHIFVFSNYFIMKNTSQETSYPLLPSLRVAFKSEEVVEVKSQKRKSRKQSEKIGAAQPVSNRPMFDDYRIKAKDHDPL